jgi:nucleotide-binding universal stress UspA family protein
MLKNILVPLDCLPVDEAALPYAQALAGRTRASLTLLHAASATPTLAAISEREEPALEDSERYLSDIAARLRDEGSNIHVAALYGQPAQSIISNIASRNIDLVVMATHDPTRARRWARGSIAETVIGHTGGPVLLIRASTGAPLADRIRTQRPVLVVPLDGSELAEAALPIARDLAVALPGKLVLVGVVPHVGLPAPARRGAPASLAEQDFQQVKDEARAYLESAASQLGSELETGIAIRSGEPGREIDQEAEEMGAAAVVMATHGRTGISRALLGSVAGQVVHSGSTPVLLVHSAKSGAGSRRGPPRIGWGMHVEDARSAHGRT